MAVAAHLLEDVVPLGLDQPGDIVVAHAEPSEAVAAVASLHEDPVVLPECVGGEHEIVLAVDDEDVFAVRHVEEE